MERGSPAGRRLIWTRISGDSLGFGPICLVPLIYSAVAAKLIDIWYGDAYSKHEQLRRLATAARQLILAAAKTLLFARHGFARHDTKVSRRRPHSRGLLFKHFPRQIGALCGDPCGECRRGSGDAPVAGAGALDDDAGRADREMGPPCPQNLGL